MSLVVPGVSPGPSDLQAETERPNSTRCIGLGHKPKPRYPPGKCPLSLPVLSSCPTSPVFINLSDTQQRTLCLSLKALKNVNYLVCPPSPTSRGAAINISVVGFLERTVCLILARVFERCPPQTHTGSIGAQSLAKATPSQPSVLPC